MCRKYKVSLIKCLAAATNDNKVLNERLPGSLPAAVTTNYNNPSLTASQPLRPISTLLSFISEEERERH